MNAARRKRLAEAVDLIASAKEIIEEVREEEQEAFGNMPESIQGSERGEEMEGFIGKLENAADDLDSISDIVGEVAGI